MRLRAERQGGSNGRVYRLGYRVTDDDGNEVDGECVVTVAHDRGGAAAIDDGDDDGVALAADACRGGTAP